ncbi:MAG: hypothetical protein IJ519_01770 [Clostridia bacterium]|nr:hypothetical protein [Clostridia bacterium]
MENKNILDKAKEFFSTNKKLAIIIGAVVGAVLVAAIVLAVLLLGGDSGIEKAHELYNAKDYSAALAILNDVETEEAQELRDLAKKGLEQEINDKISNNDIEGAVQLIDECSNYVEADRLMAKAQSSCTHSYTENERNEATCVLDGKIVSACERCGLENTEIIAANGHVIDGDTTIVKEGNCAEEGEAEGKCSVCGETVVVTTEKSGDHTYEEAMTLEATCTKSGVKTLTCTVCGETKTEDVPVTDHDYGYEAVWPGCETDGEKVYECVDCGDSYTETLPAIGHSWLEATCVSAKTCNNCGTTDGAELGHYFGNDGACVRCGTYLHTPDVGDDNGNNDYTPPSDDTSNDGGEDAIQAEYRRHREAVDSITSEYDLLIEIEERSIESTKRNALNRTGQSYLSSAGYYQNKMSSVKSEMDVISQQLAMMKRDTSGVYRLEIARKEKELDALRDEYSNYYILSLAASDIEESEDTINRLERAREVALDEEDDLHRINLAKLGA